MPTWLTALLETLANVTGFAKKRQELKNAPDMRDRAKAQSEVKSADAINSAIANRDDKKLEELGAE